MKGLTVNVLTNLLYNPEHDDHHEVPGYVPDSAEDDNVTTTTTAEPTTTAFPGYESKCYCPGDPVFINREKIKKH